MAELNPYIFPRKQKSLQISTGKRFLTDFSDSSSKKFPSKGDPSLTPLYWPRATKMAKTFDSHSSLSDIRWPMGLRSSRH